MNTPSAQDIEFPSVTYCGPEGVTMTMLRQYWRERPDVGPPMPGTHVTIATWRDGTVAAVPDDADGRTLALYYCAECAAGVLREMGSQPPRAHQ